MRSIKEQAAEIKNPAEVKRTIPQFNELLENWLKRLDDLLETERRELAEEIARLRSSGKFD